LKTMFTLRCLQALLFAYVLIHPVQGQVSNSDGVCETEPKSDETRELEVQASVAALIQWVRDEGGFIHPKLEIRAIPVERDADDAQESPDDSDDSDDEQEPDDSEDTEQKEEAKQGYSFGLFVKENETILKGEQLLHFPQTTVIEFSVKASLDMDNVCLLADELATERNLHKEKKSTLFGPYIDFLERFAVDQADLPGSWSQDAQDVLTRIVGQEFFTSFTPYYSCFMFDITGAEAENTAGYESGFEFENFDDPDYWDENIEVALSRRRNDLLVPIYDMISHSNDPNKINIITVSDSHPGTSFSVEAALDLSSGEEIQHSYGLGTPAYNHWFGFVDYGMGTMDMFRDFGFVEPYPQRWYYEVHSLDFAIREVSSNETTNAATDQPNLELVWLSDNMPDDDAIYTMDRQLDALEEIKNDILAWATPHSQSDLLNTASPSEIKSLYNFILTYITSVEMVLEASVKLRGEDESEYAVQEETITFDNVDDHLFQIYQCNSMLYTDEFEKIETLQSTYQKIDYYKDPLTNDRCLYLDDVYQQCIVSSSLTEC
jgi:hypothetical protein